jgi:hypothetical protein
VLRQLARRRLARLRPGRQADPPQGARPDQDRGTGQAPGSALRQRGGHPQAGGGDRPGGGPGLAGPGAGRCPWRVCGQRADQPGHHHARGHRSAQLRPGAQHRDIGEAIPAQRQRHHQVGEDLARVMHCPRRPPPAQTRRQATAQPGDPGAGRFPRRRQPATGLLAATRTGLPPAGDDELTSTRSTMALRHGVTSRSPFCWAHEKTGLVPVNGGARAGGGGWQLLPHMRGGACPARSGIVRDAAR